MKMCDQHWTELRHAIAVRGLNDFVAAGGGELLERIKGELEDKPQTKRNFDPLLSANFALMSNAIRGGGLYLLGLKPDGGEYCPVCEAEAHGQTGWIEKAAEGAAFAVAELPDE